MQRIESMKTATTMRDKKGSLGASRERRNKILVDCPVKLERGFEHKFEKRRAQ